MLEGEEGSETRCWQPVCDVRLLQVPIDSICFRQHLRLPICGLVLGEVFALVWIFFFFLALYLS